MKCSNVNGLRSVALSVALCAAAAYLRADDEWTGVPPQPGDLGGGAQSQAAAESSDQQMFATPDEALNALRMAVEADDQAALIRLFGPEFKSLQTGDKVEDAKNLHHFARALSQDCRLEKESESEFFVDVGTNAWPMPIPLMQTNGQWYFDTAAGREEIIDRHVGEDELTAIGVCRDYVRAQKEFASLNAGAYAEKFRSSPGKKDGLYWPTSAGEAPSPFGELVAEAQAEGYSGHHGKGRHPFFGYYFRILTRQGPAAPGGKMDYVSGGKLTRGFALVAWPEIWNQSGVMTFIVNQDGKVYQRDFGEKTDRIASKLDRYNPDKDWTFVSDEGIQNAGIGK